MLDNLHEQNLADTIWSIIALKRELKPLFKKQRAGNRCMWVCQATPALRKHLFGIGRVYIGWEVVEVNIKLPGCYLLQ